MGNQDMAKILASGLGGAKGEFEKGYKTALSMVYGMLAKGIGKEQLMDGLEDFFGVWEEKRRVYS